MSENRSVMERAIESAETVLENAKWYAEISGARENMRRKKGGKIDIAELTLKALREKAEREKGCERCNNPCNNCARLGDILGCIKCKSGRPKFKMYEKRMLSDLFCRSCGRRLEEKKDG